MSPTRIVIIAILIYIGFLLFKGGRKKKKVVKPQQPKAGSEKKVSDVLVEDPICHSLVPKQQSIHMQYHDEMVYFCSEECCQEFIKEKKL